MKLLLTSVKGRSASGPAQRLYDQYFTRLSAYVSAETQVYRTEQSLFDFFSQNRTRTMPMIVLLHSRGRQFVSESFAAWLREQKDSSRQLVIFAVGPANGWSPAALQQAGLLLSLGPMTLPHELAGVVLAEQLYRAFTILAGHPYHSGHIDPTK